MKASSKTFDLTYKSKQDVSIFFIPFLSYETYDISKLGFAFISIIHGFKSLSTNISNPITWKQFALSHLSWYISLVELSYNIYYIINTKNGAIPYKNLTIVYSILNFNFGTSIPIFINVFLADVYVLLLAKFIF